MVYVNTSNIKSRGYALQGAAFTMVLTPIALINLHLLGLTFSFIMAPLIAIFLWPRQASVVLSMLLIFGCGLFIDLMSDTPIGVWTLLYILTFVILRPDIRRREIGFGGLWAGFTILIAVLGLILLLMHGLFNSGHFAFLPLVLQLAIAALLFPFVYTVRQFVRQFVVTKDDPSFN